jgi:predicted peptidase
MSCRKWLALAALAGVAFGPLHAADKEEHGFLNRVFKDKDGKEAKYVLFIPNDYKGDKPYPVILFLHGAGETGTDGEKQAKVGIGPAIRKQEKTFPFITVMPQSQKRSWLADPDDAKWTGFKGGDGKANTEDAERALAILEEVKKTYKVDDKRVYLTGLSMGGYGTWSLAAKYPDRWAAIVPVCGKGDPMAGTKIKNVPCWAFHGDADTAVKVDGSRNMIKAMKDAGGNPKYTEYPGVGHNSWDMAYGTAELYDWLLMQKLK